MLFKNKVKLTTVSALVSIFTLICFHFPFFKHVVNNVEKGFNGTLITVGLVILMLVMNFFACYLVMWLGRVVGKILVSLSFIGDAVTLYFINTYDVLVDDTMMGNVFNTNYSEATSYWSVSALLYIVLLGVLPCVLLLLTRIEYGTFKRFLKSIGISLGIGALVGFGNITNWPWVDREAPVIGSLLMPWSYTINTFRYQAAERERNREEILLPDAEISDNEKDVVVLVIGESARRDHFSLYGYGRQTNPLLEQVEGLKCYEANSAATYTTAGVKAILDYEDTGKLYEILPNYLYRNGVDVVWRSTNWGEPPLHIANEQKKEELSEWSGIPVDYDELLLYDIKDLITGSDKDKVFIVLHTSTSHGPLYSKKYPERFGVFSPVNTSVEMSKCPPEELANAYDNSIIYTDYILSSLIDELKDLDGWNSCMMYVSDHGESLGENNLYMHGVPIKIAPKEQYEIPFIVWTSEGAVKPRAEGLLTQYHVFHSVLHFLGVDSPVYKAEFDIFN